MSAEGQAQEWAKRVFTAVGTAYDDPEAALAREVEPLFRCMEDDRQRAEHLRTSRDSLAVMLEEAVTACRKFHAMQPALSLAENVTNLIANLEALAGERDAAEALLTTQIELGERYLVERDDARNLTAEVALGITHFSHGPGEPECCRCRAERVERELAELRKAEACIAERENIQRGPSPSVGATIEAMREMANESEAHLQELERKSTEWDRSVTELEGEARVLIGCPCWCHQGNGPEPHGDCRECVRGTATPTAVDWAHTDALWREKWIAALLMGRQAERADKAETRIAELEEISRDYVRSTDAMIACGDADDPTSGTCGTCRACLLVRIAELEAGRDEALLEHANAMRSITSLKAASLRISTSLSEVKTDLAEMEVQRDEARREQLKSDRYAARVDEARREGLRQLRERSEARCSECGAEMVFQMGALGEALNAERALGERLVENLRLVLHPFPAIMDGTPPERQHPRSLSAGDLRQAQDALAAHAASRKEESHG